MRLSSFLPVGATFMLAAAAATADVVGNPEGRFHVNNY